MEHRPETTYVTAAIFDVPESEFARIAGSTEATVKRLAPTLQGLIETQLLGNQETARLLIMSRWESKEAWVRTAWNEQVGKLLADLATASTKFDVRTFVPISEVEGTGLLDDKSSRA